MRLLLSGGGDPQAVVPLDEFFVSQIDLSKPVLYVPVAMEESKFTYYECFAWFSRTYKPYGIGQMDMSTDLRLAPSLEKYAAVYFGGGNTFKLMKEIRESGFDKSLMSYITGGGFVYGGSAGAIIFGATIATAHDPNTVGLEDLSGFDLVGGKDIWVHYTPDEDALIQAYPRGLYVLYEESGLYTSDNGVEYVGRPFLRQDVFS
jgi:dipeptidase E